MSEYFPKLRLLGGNVKFELDLPNYATKADLIKAIGFDASNFAKKVHIASLKSEIDKLDIGKLESTPVDLSKLSDAVKNEFVKNTVLDELVKKCNVIQATDNINLIKKTDYDIKIDKIKMKILDQDHDKYILKKKNLIS